jgi:hypothetical protein
MDYLARHTMTVWLWTLSRRQGTPCMPLIVRWQCTTAGHCGGIGDRIKGIQVGFWLVRNGLPQHPNFNLPVTPTPTLTLTVTLILTAKPYLNPATSRGKPTATEPKRHCCVAFVRIGSARCRA